MRGLVAGILLLSFGSAAVQAAKMQQDVTSRWLGAWVVSGIELSSDCAGSYTNNRVHGRLVSGRGAWRFEPGELGQVVKLDLKDTRVDVFVELAEPRLLSYVDGPFTLYREARCRVELEVVVSREAVKQRDVAGIDAALATVLQRFPSAEQARGAESWNGRLCEDYPADYELTLARHAAWQATEANAAVHAQIERARREASRFADRFSADPAYLDGFVVAVERARERVTRSCAQLLAVDPAQPGAPPPSNTAPGDAPAEVRRRFEQGYEDGLRLVVGLELLEGLPGCLVPVPLVPGGSAEPGPDRPHS